MSFKRFVELSLLALMFLLVSGLSFAFFWYRSGGLQETLVREMGRKFLSIETNPPGAVNDYPMEITDEISANFVQKFFGLEEPRTYLILFLNNTELRPGGGFIGTYAVVRMDRATPEVIKVEGTEIIDNNAPKDFKSVPPAPIGKYLDVKRWYFRDSNWSPDYAMSAAKSLELYAKEKGVMADEIDAVVAFTPTVIEELLKISGPIKAGGIEFTAENFTEKLEYEVEYGFANKGIHFDDRKSLLKDLAKQVIMNSMKNVFTSWGEYKHLTEKMLSQKQIVMYSPRQEFQEIFETKNWAGKMSAINYDYLLWADANLGALKTDASINRSIRYELFASSSGQYIARARMTYKHDGVFDWRTTRYLNYARVFAPKGSKLIGAGFKPSGSDKVKSIAVDSGVENGRQWFGAFISVEPKSVGELFFEYYVAPEVQARIQAKDYKLLVQKQIGTNKVGLTLGLNFANTLSYVFPGEAVERQGDGIYQYSTTMVTDKEFEIRIK